MRRPIESPPDAVHVEAARAGDTTAFDPLVERYFGMVFTLALGRLGRPEAAEDLAQEVFLRAWLHLDRLDVPERFAGWITRMTRNLATDWMRRGQVRSRLLPMVSLSDLERAEIPDPRLDGVREQMETRERTERIQEAVLGLPADLREVVLLRFMERLKTGEIARRLEIDTSTVRRRLTRGVDRLRETLERDLTDSLEGLRPSRRALTQASRIVVAASVLSAGAEASLCAAAGDTFLLAGAVASSATAKGTSAALLYTLKSIPASLAGGGIVMGSTKGIVLIATVVVLGIGGLVYYQHTGNSGGPAGGLPPNGNGTVNALDVASGELSPLDGTADARNRSNGVDETSVVGWLGESNASIAETGGPVPAGEISDGDDDHPDHAPWAQVVQEYLQDHPDEAEGLTQLLRALEGVRPDEVRLYPDLIAQVLSSGWSPEAAVLLGPLLESHRGALEAARKAAEAAPFHTPPRTRFDDPIPDFLDVQCLNKLMLLEALRLDAEGKSEEAVWEAVLAARLSDRFRSPSVGVLSHLIGMVGTSAASRMLSSSLQDPALSPELLQQVRMSLAALEDGQTSVENVARSESTVQVEWIRRLVDDPAALQAELAQLGEDNIDLAAGLEEAVRDFPAYEEEHRRTVDSMLANIQKPYWNRTWYDETELESLAVNPYTRALLHAMLVASVRSDAALAQTRLCQALCALRLGRDDIVAGLIDPFTGEPFRVERDRIYSLGPDREDQGGVLPYVSANGVRSPGDLFILFDEPIGT